MPLFPDAPIRLHVRGRVRGQVLDGAASLAVDADAVVIAPLDHALHTAAIIRLPYDALDGAGHDAAAGGTLYLYQNAGEVVTAHGSPRVTALGADILDRGRSLPELTRAARGLGARGGGPGQEAFFQPLLDARRQAAGGWSDALAAFDAVQLREAVGRILSRLAAEREPERASARRALEACLHDAAEPLFLALQPLASAAADARTADSAVALRAWRRWVAAVRAVFERADAAWPELRALLAAPPRPAAPTPATPLERLLPPWTR